MLKGITRDDLTELYRIVMNRYGVNGPEDELEKVLWGYLKNMFEEPLSKRLQSTMDMHLSGGQRTDYSRVNTPGSDENSLKLYDLIADMKEISSGSPTSYLSLPDYEAFFYDSEPDSGNFTMDVVEDIFDNPTRKPRVHVPNVLPTYPTLHLDLDFTLSSESFRSDLVVSFPSRTRNKIFDPGIFIEVQSKRFLSPNEFSISFSILVFLLLMRRNLLISYLIGALKLSSSFLKAR
ncbi:hypothetical protein Tco_1249552 [Tanacetum coccineum]